MNFSLFKKMKLLSLLILPIGCLSLSSCSAFFGGGYLINEVTTTVDQDGNTIVTISFDDDSIEPVVFTIPRGISGHDGVGIKEVLTEVDSETGMLILTITYTDENVADTIVNIPVLNGEDGLGIANVNMKLDELGNTIIQFVYTDGSTSEEITLKKGEDGVGIENIEHLFDEESNSTILIVHYTDGTQSDPIYIKNGEDAVGIITIDSIDNGDSFTLSILFTDGSTQDITISKPSVNKWLNGNGVPSQNIGNEGDFYFDNETGSVYRKTADYWNLLFSMTGTGTSVNYQVRFKTNGGTWRYVDSTDPSSANADKVIVVNENSFIDLNSTEFAVVNENFTFNGWRTDATINANSGHFTVLTPVNSDLTLYANWIE